MIILLLLYILLPTQLQSPVQEETTVTFNKPPDLKREINSTQDILDDLTSLNCLLIDVSIEDTKLEPTLTVNNYSDFRWIAYNTKLVYFSTTNQNSTTYLYTPLHEEFHTGFRFVEKQERPNGTTTSTTVNVAQFQTATVNFQLKEQT